MEKLLINAIELIKIFKSVLNKTPEKEIIEMLIEQKKTISCAESCTGGLLSSLLTDISGSSAVIQTNFVTYANSSKEKYLKVNSETLGKYGAVSEQTAEEMAKGLQRRTLTNFAITTTGIAGPTGNTPEKPIGLMYVGISDINETKTYKIQLNPNINRRLMKMVFAKKALFLLKDFIENRR